MLGNEAFARSAYEGGVEVASGYPGTPSTEILEFLSQYHEVHSRWCPNEKVAFEVAAGAAIGGKRALATMKHVGLNVASDALMTLAYTGVNAVFVFIVADDPVMHSSQNEQDSRNYALFAKIPFLEPADSSEALVFTLFAFEISEEFDTPVMISSTTRVSHSRGVITLGERKSLAVRPYQKCASKLVMIPDYARQRRLLLEELLQRLNQWVEETPLNRVEIRDPSLGIITTGVLYNYLREVAPSVSTLKLGVLPPLSSIDTCLCMGASISVAEGIKLAHPELSVAAVIGDYTFIHAGIPPLIDTVYNKTPIVVIVLDNGTTAMTGGQEHPAIGKTRGEETTRLDFMALGKAIGIPRVEKVNAYNLL